MPSRTTFFTTVAVVCGILAPAGGVAKAKPAPQCPRSGVTIMGTARADVINGTAGADVICGLGGNDTIRGRGGNDKIYGGEGKDTLTGGPGDDQIAGGGGKDTIKGNAGQDHIWGDGYLGADRQPATAGRDVIRSGAGGDAVFGGPGNDYIDTGSATDVGNVSAGTDIGDGQAGNDVVIGTGPVFSSQFSGGDGHDLLAPFPLRGSPVGNTASGGSGNDVIVLANGLRDSAQLTVNPQIPIPETPCSVVVPLAPHSTPGAAGQLQCGLPWNLPGVGKIGTLEVAVATDGSFTYGGDLVGGLGRTNDAQLNQLASGQSSAQVDVCLCDPDLPGLWTMGDVIL